jgi:hypothetical protein
VIVNRRVILVIDELLAATQEVRPNTARALAEFRLVALPFIIE